MLVQMQRAPSYRTHWLVLPKHNAELYRLLACWRLRYAAWCCTLCTYGVNSSFVTSRKESQVRRSYALCNTPRAHCGTATNSTPCKGSIASNQNLARRKRRDAHFLHQDVVSHIDQIGAVDAAGEQSCGWTRQVPSVRE